MKFTGLMCAICFFIGLPLCSESGPYILDIMDTYGGGLGVLAIGICELAAIHWLYGVRRFCKDIEMMLGFEPGWYWKICWAVVSPVLLTLIFIAGLVDWDASKYPPWAQGVGWCVAGVSVLQIPLWAIIMPLYYHFKKGNVWDVLKSEPSWGPGDKEAAAAAQELVSYSYDHGSSRNEPVITGYDNRGADFPRYQQ